MIGDRYVDGRTLHGRVAWKMEFRSRWQIERNDRKLDWIQGKNRDGRRQNGTLIMDRIRQYDSSTAVFFERAFDVFVMSNICNSIISNR